MLKTVSPLALGSDATEVRARELEQLRDLLDEAGRAGVHVEVVREYLPVFVDAVGSRLAARL